MCTFTIILIFKHIWLLMIWNFLVNTSTELGFENLPKFQSINTCPGKKPLPFAYPTTGSTTLGFGTIWLGTIKTSIFTLFSPVVAIPDKLLFTSLLFMVRVTTYPALPGTVPGHTSYLDVIIIGAFLRVLIINDMILLLITLYKSNFWPHFPHLPPLVPSQLTKINYLTSSFKSFSDSSFLLLDQLPPGSIGFQSSLVVAISDLMFFLWYDAEGSLLGSLVSRLFSFILHWELSAENFIIQN